MITLIKDKADKLISTKCKLDDQEAPEYFIAKSKDSKTVHYGELTKGLEMETGQPVVTMYKDRTAWVKALALLKITPDIEDVKSLQNAKTIECNK